MAMSRAIRDRGCKGRSTTDSRCIKVLNHLQVCYSVLKVLREYQYTFP